MKICNSCMQMTGDTTDVCPVCKMHDFTPLDSKQASRERQVKKLKKSKGVYRKPRRNIRRVRYSLGSMKRNSAIRSLGTFVVGSLILSVILNSTVWAGPGNPLDVRNFREWFNLGESGASLNVDEFPVDITDVNSGYEVQLDSVFLHAPYVDYRLQLVINLEAKNTSGTYKTELRKPFDVRLFDDENWEQQECVGLTRNGGGTLLPGETQQITECFQVEGIDNFRLLYGSMTFQIAAEDIQQNEPQFSPNDKPDPSLPGTLTEVLSYPYAITINEASRDGNFGSMSISFKNLSDEAVPFPSEEALFSDGSRASSFGIRSRVPGGSYDIPAGETIQIDASFGPPEDLPFELRFFIFTYSSDTGVLEVHEVASFYLEQ